MIADEHLSYTPAVNVKMATTVSLQSLTDIVTPIDRLSGAES